MLARSAFWTSGIFVQLYQHIDHLWSHRDRLCRHRWHGGVVFDRGDDRLGVLECTGQPDLGAGRISSAVAQQLDHDYDGPDPFEQPSMHFQKYDNLSKTQTNKQTKRIVALSATKSSEAVHSLPSSPWSATSSLQPRFSVGLPRSFQASSLQRRPCATAHRLIYGFGLSSSQFWFSVCHWVAVYPDGRLWSSSSLRPS